MGPIGASKAALASVSDALRVELSPWGIPVVLIEPGATATRIFERAQTVADASLLDADQCRRALYRAQLEAVRKAGSAQKLGPVERVAEAIVNAIEARRPKRRYTVGADARAAGLLLRLPAGMRDRVVASALGVSNVKPQA
jgi:NAD(P)-dependent dehydrogenase (short-subunit alcohol dehydrogenase family)